jgi:hypothetical protein
MVLGRIGLSAQFGDDLTVHGHQSAGDQFFGMPPRGDAGLRDQFL